MQPTMNNALDLLHAMHIRFAFFYSYYTAPLTLASSLNMDVNISGTDYTGIIIPPFTISLNARSIQHSETYTTYPRWEHFPLWVT